MYVKNISIFVVPISEKYVYSIFFTLKNKIAVSKYVHKKCSPIVISFISTVYLRRSILNMPYPKL